MDVNACGFLPGRRHKDQRLRRYRPLGQAVVEIAFVETEADIDPAIFELPQEIAAARDLQPKIDLRMVALKDRQPLRKF
jgi:hypothetical protein